MARTPKVVEDRREQIIKAAMHVFAQKGYARATNRDVAREAGITTGLIYYYFESKEALLKAVLEERSPFQILAQITPEMLELPPEILLPQLILRVLRIVENEEFLGILRVLLSELLHDPQMLSLPTTFIQRMLSFLGMYFQAQISKGTVRPDIKADVVTHMMAGSILTFVVRRQLLHDPEALRYTHQEIADAVVNTLLDGIRPD
ncbi:MAG TPA: TetR/AcrR family transcriptional regulator [Ktedonobacteraceae bacterium]|nr:TetR/AcrR family transcriptional regulator [Ktedonobacteraceae bacterium]